MKTLKIVLFSFLFIALAQISFAQSVKKETFKVAGECGMCKKKIESAAKQAGASYAVWNVDSKKLTVKYKSSAITTAAIQQSIAVAGYDTPGFKASDDAYNNLHECCKYNKDEACCATADCCEGGNCREDHSCCADGQCKKDTACCQESGKGTDCCKKS